MDDNETPHSGSRWEPARAPEPTPRTDHGTADTASDPTDETVAFATDPAPRAAPRRRGLMAAAAVGLVALGSLGGFAVAAATAGEGSDEVGLVGNQFPGDDSERGEHEGDDGFHGDHGGLPPAGGLPSDDDTESEGGGTGT